MSRDYARPPRTAAAGRWAPPELLRDRTRGRHAGRLLPRRDRHSARQLARPRDDDLGAGDPAHRDQPAGDRRVRSRSRPHAAAVRRGRPGADRCARDPALRSGRRVGGRPLRAGGCPAAPRACIPCCRVQLPLPAVRATSRPRDAAADPDRACNPRAGARSVRGGRRLGGPDDPPPPRAALAGDRSARRGRRARASP